MEGFSDRSLAVLAEVADGSTGSPIEMLPAELAPVFRVAGTPASEEWWVVWRKNSVSTTSARE